MKKTRNVYYITCTYGISRWYISYDRHLKVGIKRDLEASIFNKSFLNCFDLKKDNSVFSDYFESQKKLIFDTFFAKRTKKTEEKTCFTFCNFYKNIQEKIELLIKLLSDYFIDYKFELEVEEVEEIESNYDPLGNRFGGEEFKLD